MSPAPNGFAGGQGREPEDMRTGGEVLLVYVVCAAVVAAILLTWWLCA